MSTPSWSDETSAFGVIHKSYKKLGPKLYRSGTQTPRPTDSLQDRQKVNYRQWRTKAGALQRELNPNRWKANDEANLKAGFGPPSARSLESRAKGEARTREKARNLKQGAKAMITGHANAGKNNRWLP